MPAKLVKRVLFTQDEIKNQIKRTARNIAAQFPSITQVVVVMEGAVPFAADLVRELPFPVRLSYCAVSTYKGKEQVVKDPEVTWLTQPCVSGATVLILDDISDSGNTMRAVAGTVKELGAARIVTCALVNRLSEAKLDDCKVGPMFAALMITGEEFLVGYGMDVDGDYRDLPFIGVAP